MSSYLVRTSELDKRKACTAMTNSVRERRTARGLSQGQLAAALAVSRQTINSIETGRYVPSLPLALALARYFETTVEEMFDASDD
jgi:putative transcriptional regulator